MDSAISNKIRERAYFMWLEDGQQSGQEDYYWYEAEREILQSEADEQSDSDSAKVGYGVSENSLPTIAAAMPQASAKSRSSVRGAVR
jgi:hypothetical protein